MLRIVWRIMVITPAVSPGARSENWPGAAMPSVPGAAPPDVESVLGPIRHPAIRTAMIAVRYSLDRATTTTTSDRLCFLD